MNSRSTNRLALLFLGLAFAHALSAQPSNRLSLEASVHYGFLWKHTPKLRIRTGQPVWGEELGLRWQTRGRYAWHAWQRFPALGLTLAHFRFGQDSHGDGYALLPNLRIALVRKGWLSAWFRLGSGLAWVTQPYDPFTNPGENAIGSHANNITQFRFEAECRLTGHWRLTAGAALNHFSDGAFALPNYGINVPAGFASFSWSPKPLREADFKPSETSRRAEHRYGALVQGGLALIEYNGPDGPRYPVWSGSAAGFFHLNKVNRLLLGADYEYNAAVRWWGLNSTRFITGAEARRGATRIAVFAGHEFLFGDLGIQLQIGRYLGGPDFNVQTLRRMYSKLSMRGYLPRVTRLPIRPYLGITLKAHEVVAEFISLHAGFEIGPKRG